MTARRNIGRALGACALALALTGFVPAAAFAVPGEYELEITALAKKDGENVVSVVVPSSVSIVVKTSVVDGRILGFDTSDAEISNAAHSYAPIKAEVSSVTDTPTSETKLLDFVEMTFRGDHEVPIVAGDNQRELLFDAIDPGTSGALKVDLSQKDPDVLVPAGSYLIRAMLRVSPA